MTTDKESRAEALFSSSVQMEDADNYNDWTFALFRPYLTGDVLEVGCGVGSFTRRIIDHGHSNRLLSIDISPEAVEHCRSRLHRPNLEIQCIDVRHVRGEFDAIVCMNVLEHIDDDRGTLEHLLTLLRPGGTLFLLVPAHMSLFSRFDAENGHFRRYNKRDMRALVSSMPIARQFGLKQFYFNAVGALGYWFVYKVLRKAPDPAGMAEIDLFDRWMVPVLRRLEGRWMPFGLSLVSVFSRGRSDAP
jgi:SAM-dependent methyltransferase